MLQPGTVDAAGNWLEALSLARSIENEMVADGLIDPSDETEEAALQRRRTLIAMARGTINYFKTHMDLVFGAGDLRALGDATWSLPANEKSYTVTGGQITIPSGDIRPASDATVPVPLTTKTLTGKVR